MLCLFICCLWALVSVLYFITLEWFIGDYCCGYLIVLFVFWVVRCFFVGCFIVFMLCLWLIYCLRVCLIVIIWVVFVGVMISIFVLFDLITCVVFDCCFLFAFWVVCWLLIDCFIVFMLCFAVALLLGVCLIATFWVGGLVLLWFEFRFIWFDLIACIVFACCFCLVRVISVLICFNCGIACDCFLVLLFGAIWCSNVV